MTYSLGDTIHVAGVLHTVIGYSEISGQLVTVTRTDRKLLPDVHVDAVPRPKRRPRTSRREYTAHEIAMLRTWTAQRVSVKEQAQRLGKSPASVINVRYRNGITARGLPCVECGGSVYGRGLCEKCYRKQRRATA